MLEELSTTERTTPDPRLMLEAQSGHLSRAQALRVVLFVVVLVEAGVANET
jgi:hypothetical protein